MFGQFDEAAAYVRQHGVTMVDLKFCDLAGRWRHVTLPAERFTTSLMEDGVGFDGSSVGLRSVKSGDLVLVPDLATAFLDPFPEEKTLSFLCRILEADDRSPVLFDPRTIAARLTTYLTMSTASQASTRGSSGISISHCPGPPTSWWWYFTGTPTDSRMREIFVRASSRWSWGGRAW